MKTLKTFAVAATLAVALTPGLLNHAVAQVARAASSVVAADHSMRASKMIGMDIFNEKHEKIGKIVDILVKGAAEEPMAVLSVGAYTGSGTKMVAVPLSHITMKSDQPAMEATKATLMAMPGWAFTGLMGGGG